jgi:hypothetical protein
VLLLLIAFGSVPIIIANKKNSITIEEPKLIYDAHLFHWHVVFTYNKVVRAFKNVCYSIQQTGQIVEDHFFIFGSQLTILSFPQE